METPLIPRRSGVSSVARPPNTNKSNNVAVSGDSTIMGSNCGGGIALAGHLMEPKTKEANGNNALTKSVSTPASLQTVVRFHNGSNMSLHHRVI